jgi:hypothetical protein
MKWIDDKDLEIWASRRDSQEYLPLVIRRLIRATASKIDSISFPAGESIVYPGWDGRLESKEETEYIPKGLSLWELTTRKDIKTKAEEDYKKRKETPLVSNPSEATYIFVTLRVWSNKDKWVEEKKKEKFWRDVRVYDARDLEEWLEQAPAVGIWLAKHIGKYPEKNIRSLEDWWNEWSLATQPPLPPELVLAGRDEQIEDVKNWLNSDPSRLVVQSSTKDEAIAFLAAVILTLSEEEKEHFLSKSIVISDEEAFRHVTTTCKNSLLLITEFEEIEIVASQHNHYLFVPLGPDNTVTKNKIILPRLERDEFISALKKMGISEEDAEKLSRDTARSLTVLRRRLSPVSKQPEWAKPERAREILPVLLVGKWDENKQGDKEIISEIAGISYNAFISNLKKWLYKPDPPILKIGEIWRLTSPLDAFFALSSFLTRGDFEKLKEVSLKVLREIDPSLNLEPEKRWMASVYGKETKYSKTLREGIVQSLVLIAVFGDEVNLDLPYSSQIWVDRVVDELLNNADWKLWHSLSDVLPHIAEASPSSFLDAVEDSLSQNPPPIMGMFSETDDALTSHSAHPSLLWALEGLAWDPNLLGRVTLILGKLAKLDPGGKLADRLINSLRDIFLLWLPHTFATLEQRLRALDVLIEREPEIGWKLLISLMPRSYDFCSPTHKPRWRQFSNKADNRVTIKELIESISAIVDKILKNAGNDGKKWTEIMERYSDLPTQEREKILRELSSSVDLIEDSRFDLWNKLREILSNHRSFPDAKWAPPEKELKEIEEIYNTLEPKDIKERYLWLFDDYWPKLPEGKERGDYRKFEQIVTQKRIKAIQDIKAELGIEGLIKLAEQSKNPYIVGTITAELPLADNEEESLFSLLSAEEKKVTFIQGYIWRKAFKSGDTWIKKIVEKALSKQWNSIKAVNLFLALPQNRIVWNFLEKFDVQIQEEYWRKVQPRFFDSSPKDKIYALEKLMNVKRHFTALHTAAMFAKDLPPKLIAELLGKAALEKSIDDFRVVSPWDIEQLFEILDQSEEIEKNEIAKLEWLYLPILASVGSERPPQMLHQRLSNDPEFFAEVIRWIYKPKSEGSKEEEDLPKELEEQRAHLAWELLNTWKIIPGSDSSGRIDYQKLKSWIEKARDLCKKLGRLEVCDSHIGQVLAWSIPDENGNWPPEEVCKVIEEIQSKELERGFSTGVYNKRGIVTKSPFEGGEQERKLAEKYRKYADKCSIQFHRTASVLKKIAETYEFEAKQEDKEAEKRRLEW